MDSLLTFSSRPEFRAWLAEHCLTSGGVWLLFGKAGGPKTLTANDALEEALCFGWIDGQMQSMDDHSYKNTSHSGGRTASGQKRTKRSPKRWSRVAS